jgi:transposase-like protein
MARKNTLTDPHFHDEDAARAWFEAARWPNGPNCSHCGSLKHYATKKPGRYRCGEKECRKDFTVMTGTVMERSHAKLTQWAAAFHMAASSKKGFSAHQLHRTLGCEYNTAWFLWHRVREAMRRGGLEPMGGPGKTVEIDETYIGKLDGQVRQQHRNRKGGGGGASSYKNTILTLVERGGSARSFHVASTTLADVMPVIRANVARETYMMTDEASWYRWLGKEFASHDRIEHSADEYVRVEADKIVTTNSVEGFYSIFKRGMRGTYQHCKEKHLHRYLAEFDFRYSTRTALGYNDEERAVLAVRGGDGKRLMYRQPHAV